MNKNELISTFIKQITPFLTEKGFISDSNSKIQYKRVINDIVHYITCFPRKAQSGGFAMAPGFGIRIPKIESIVHSQDQLTTVGMPLHLLKPDKEYKLWGFDSTKEIVKSTESIISEIQTYGLAFLDTFSSSENVYSSISSDNPKNWFMCSNDYRDTLLIAFSYVKFGKEKALAIGKEFLKTYEKQSPKFYKQLTETIKKIEAL